MNFIKNFNSQVSEEQENFEAKLLENKRACEKFLEQVKTELIDMISIIKINFKPLIKEKNKPEQIFWENLEN